MIVTDKKCKCGLKTVLPSNDFSWFWEAHSTIQCTQLRRLGATTPPAIEFVEVETVYRLKNGAALHRRDNDNYDYKVVYPSGDTIYYNADKTVNYVVDWLGKPWW